MNLLCFCGYGTEPTQKSTAFTATNVPLKSVYTYLEPYYPLHLFPRAKKLKKIPVLSKEVGNVTHYTIKAPLNLKTTQSFEIAVHIIPYKDNGTSIVFVTGPVSLQDRNNSLTLEPINLRLSKDSAGLLRELEINIPYLNSIEHNENLQLSNGLIKIAASTGKKGVRLYSAQLSFDKYSFDKPNYSNEYTLIQGGKLNFNMIENDDTIKISLFTNVDKFEVNENCVKAVTSKFDIANIDLPSVVILQNIGRELFRLSLLQKNNEDMNGIAMSAAFQAIATIPVLLRRNLEVGFRMNGYIKNNLGEGSFCLNSHGGLNVNKKAIIIDPQEFIQCIWACLDIVVPSNMLSSKKKSNPFVLKNNKLHFSFSCTNGIANINGVESPINLKKIIPKSMF